MVKCWLCCVVGVENPPLPVVQRFVHLLDQRATDFAEEIELQELKQSVIQRIKANNEHEKALNSMDIKIGLLVKNRISLQVRHSYTVVAVSRIRIELRCDQIV